MTRNATFDFHGLMFKYERARLICMAGEAHRVLSRRRAQLRGLKTAVLVVAIGALQQTFVYAMVKGLGELRPDVLMAGVTQRRLAGYQEKLGFLGVMRGMAVRACYVAAAMCGTQEIAVFLAILMAGQAARRGLLRSGSFENKYFGPVAPSGNVRFARAVAGFTSLIFRSSPRIEGRLPVRRFLERRINFIVAGFASLGSNVSGCGTLPGIGSRG